jgi:Dockerin type I domain
MLGTWAAAPARGADINLGRVVVKPDTPGQRIGVSVSGGEQVAAVELYAQIGDGGAFNGGSGTRPVFREVDLVTGTIFQNNNTGQTADNRGLVINAGTVTNSGSVAAAGLLARLTVDTTGQTTPQSFPFILTNVAPNAPGGPFQTQLLGADARPVPLSVTNGSIFSTYYGDANLDAAVNGVDFALLAGSFGKTGQTWETGDFNRDGSVNGSDFALLAQNFGRSQPAALDGAAAGVIARDWMALEAFAANRGVPLSNVPEPGAGAVALAAAWGLLRRKRRRLG